MRNEAAHVERVARAVAAQTHPPAAWVVVDDDSTDDTAADPRRLEEEIGFLSVCRAEPDAEPVVDRLAVAAAPRAFNYGLASARPCPTGPTWSSSTATSSSRPTTSSG